MAIRFLCFGCASMVLSLHRSLWLVRVFRRFCDVLFSGLQMLAFSLLVAVCMIVFVVLI